MKGWDAVVWLIMITPLLIVGGSFFHSIELGLLVLSVILACILVCVCLAILIARQREVCPKCGEKELKRAGLWRTNPGPSISTSRCENCAREFKRFVGSSEFEEIAPGSHYSSRPPPSNEDPN